LVRSPAHATPGATDANEARHPEALLKADALQSAIFQTASSSDLIISELKASQEALRASEERFGILFELGPTAAYSCDATGYDPRIQPPRRRAFGSREAIDAARKELPDLIVLDSDDAGDHRDSAGPDMNPSPRIADHPPRILIVDDERDNRELLAVILGWEGFLILSAASGEEALVTMAQQPVDLILLDVMMPSMNGFQVVAQIKGNLATKNVPVILVSALADRNARTLALNAGAEDFLEKPLDRGELVLRVKDLLRKTYADYHDN
jgi:CheY-like chemotaxis protein